jgi:uncharacterized protein
MRFLVSGSTGLIGEALVAKLENDRHIVHRVVRSRPSEGEAALDLEGGTLDCSRLPDGSLERVDVVVNLSGERLTPTRWTAAKRERVRTSRIVVTDILARTIAKSDSPPAAFLSASAVGYYGDRRNEELDEESPHGDGFLAELCRAWERATGPASDRGVRTVNLRSGVVIARRNPLIAAQLPLFRLGLGFHIGSGRQWMSWIQLDDEIDAIIHAALTPTIEGACNLVAPNPVRNLDFTRDFAAVVGRRSVFGVSRPVLNILIGREATREIATASQRVFPRRLSDTGFSFSYETIGEALESAIDGR